MLKKYGILIGGVFKSTIHDCTITDARKNIFSYSIF